MNVNKDILITIKMVSELRLPKKSLTMMLHQCLEEFHIRTRKSKLNEILDHEKYGSKNGKFRVGMMK